MPERRLSFLIISPLLTIALGLWVLASALALTVGEPEQTKELVNKSGLYQAIIPEQVADTQKANPALAGVPLDNPEIQKILATSLDSQKLQHEGDKAVDAIYVWLEGNSARPTIDISVKADQQALAVAAGDYAAKYAAGLPACAPGEADYAAFSADPLAATCLPVGVGPEMVRSAVQQTVATSPALGTTTELTEDDIKLAGGKTIMEAFSGAPAWYQGAQLLPIISIVIAVVCITLLVLTLKLAKGTKSAGKHLLSVGITLVVVAVALAWGLEKLFTTFVSKSENPNVADALMQLSTLFNNALRSNMVKVSSYLIVAGAALLICGYILSRLHRSGKLTPGAETTSLTSSSPKTSFIPKATHQPVAAPVAKKPARRTAKKQQTPRKKKK